MPLKNLQSYMVSGISDFYIALSNPSYSTLDPEECGESFAVGSRIFGGSEIERGQYPWMAAFFCNNHYRGGGSLSK